MLGFGAGRGLAAVEGNGDEGQSDDRQPTQGPPGRCGRLFGGSKKRVDTFREAIAGDGPAKRSTEFGLEGLKLVQGSAYDQ